MDKAARAALLTAKRKDNASENIADYVADLLRQGRASEVTDDLMAQADPQRLHQHYTSGNTGMDLPMDYASRMERADTMGFQDKNYHGTPHLPLDKLKPSEFGAVGRGVYLTKRPVTATDYARGYGQMNPNDTFIQDNERHTVGGNIIPVMTKGELQPFKDWTESKMANLKEQGLYGSGYKADEAASNAAEQSGFSGVQARNENSTVFDPTNIRSQFARFDPRLEHLAHLSASTGGAMDFARHVEAVNRAGGQIAPSKYLPDVPRQVHADGGRINANGGGTMDLRSKAAEIVRSQPQAKGSVDQLLAMVGKTKGVKQAELLNAGRPAGNSVSKEELAQHFEDAVPKIQVQRSESTTGGLSEAEKQRMQHLESIGPHNLNANELSEWAQLATREDNKNQAKYGQHTLPGGENYREHLLHLPQGNGDTFRSNHWETPNVLAHLRMKDRDNGKTLHVEEVQSDWGQQGREQGLYDPEKPFEVVRKGTNEVVSRHSDWSSMWDAYRLHPESDQLNYGDVRSEKVPQAPYVGNTQHWTDLSVKHALTEAAKGGHDRVVFSPGEANADLYGQRKQIGKIQFIKRSNPEGGNYIRIFDKETSTPEEYNVNNKKEINKIIGNENSEKLLSKPEIPLGGFNGNEHYKELQGPLMVGGHGMVDYYNNIVHPSALKLLQQHDPSIKPESYDLPNGYKGFALPMTDKARQSILGNGFQAFKDGGTVDDDDDGITAYHGSPHSFDQFDISKLGTGEGAQAYGHGLYFAGNEKVAKGYRDALNSAFRDVLGYAGPDKSRNAASMLAADIPEHEVMSALSDLGDVNPSASLETGRKILSNAKSSGHMYKVKLNVKPEELLDWDKPLSEQHPRVQEVLRTFGAKPEDTGAKAYLRAGTHKFAVVGPNGKSGPGGSTYEESLAQVGGDPSKVRSILDTTPQARSAGLLAQGIKGIKYRDADSRDLSDGDPTHNYVMFHHDPVQVMDKYEYGGTVAIPKAQDVSAALALTRRFSKDGTGATASLRKKPL